MDHPILYIHGFASSAHSGKAHQLRARFRRVFVPSLPTIPQLALETLETLLDALAEPSLLIGSSLGGYYATVLAARRRLPAVLVNPVVELNVSLEKHIGMNRSYFDDSQFEFTADHYQQLRAMAPRTLPVERLLLLVQMGDELLDHRRTVEILAGAEIHSDMGGNHGFEGFAQQLDRIEAFAQRQFVDDVEAANQA